MQSDSHLHYSTFTCGDVSLHFHLQRLYPDSLEFYAHGQSTSQAFSIPVAKIPEFIEHLEQVHAKAEDAKRRKFMDAAVPYSEAIRE